MLLLDSRVGSNCYYDGLSKKLVGQVVMTTLEFGDVAFEGNYVDGQIAIGIEIKKLGDCLASMRSGRYLDQMNGMAEVFSVSYLLIEGSYAPDANGVLCTPTRGGWAPLNLQSRKQKRSGGRRNYFMYSELDKFLASLEVIENVVVRKSCNQIDTIAQLSNTYSWWQKPFELHSSTKGIKLQSGALAYKASLCRRVASELPGIGAGRAIKVEKKFKTVEALANALPSEWSDIPGIGERTALGVYKSIRGEK